MMLKLLKTFWLLIVVIFCNGQNLTTANLYRLYTGFKSVEDSIVKQINPDHSFIIKTCEGNRSFYFTLSAGHWKGYFIKNIAMDGLLPARTIDTLMDGRIIKYEPHFTELYTFTADKLVKELMELPLASIEQLSEETIQSLLVKTDTRKNKRTHISLPFTSHDCNFAIEVNEGIKAKAVYRGALVRSEELHSIKTLKVFSMVDQMLRDFAGVNY